MNILLSNDDGIESNGLRSLAKKLAKNNNVLVVAPDGNRSAASHSLSIFKKIKVKEDFSINGCKAYKISGTPADCVKFAKLQLSDFNVDIVVAGINNAHNIGSDIMYSGTVAIACEASFFSNISFAFSAFDKNIEFIDYYADISCKIIEQLMPMSKAGDFWNINFPIAKIEDIKGIKITQLGKQLYSDRYQKVSDDEYMLVGELLEHNENEQDCDVVWIQKGYITITPILFNKTNYKKIEEVKEKCIKL